MTIMGAAVEIGDAIANLSQHPLHSIAERRRVARRGVVARDMNGGRTQVIENSSSPNQRGGYAGHARAAERIEDDISGFRVSLDETGYRLGGNLRMVGVDAIEGRRSLDSYAYI